MRRTGLKAGIAAEGDAGTGFKLSQEVRGSLHSGGKAGPGEELGRSSPGFGEGFVPYWISTTPPLILKRAAQGLR